MGTRGGISVVHVFPADGDYVVKLSMHNEPLGGIYGRYSMLTMNITEQIEVSVNGERVALLDLNPRMSETDQPERPERPRDQDAADSHQRRPAAHLGGVHPAARRTGGRFDRAAREHAGRREHQLRCHRAAAHARHDDPRSVAGDRRLGNREPAEDLHLPADERERRRDLRGRDPQEADDPGVPRHGERRRCAGRAVSSTSRGARRAISRTASAWRCSRSWSARDSCSGSSRRRRQAGAL